jgi:hypothetical protein
VIISQKRKHRAYRAQPLEQAEDQPGHAAHLLVGI